MQNLSKMLRTAERFTKDHSPVILTALGVSGTILTAVLTGKATIEATRIVDHMNSQRYQGTSDDPGPETPAPPKEIVKAVWRLYIPPLSVAALTVTSIIGANRIGARRTAAMAAAYTIAERGFEEYKAKVTEKLGERKAREVHDEVQQDRVTKNPPPQGMGQLLVAPGDALCHDAYSDRWFKSSHQKLLAAQNEFNYRLLNDDAQSLNDFYSILELPHVRMGDMVGWTSMEKLELVLTATLTPDNQPAIAVDFLFDPKEGYSSKH